MKNTPLSRQSNLVVQELDKELLIYDLSDNKAYCLNETSALVYQLSDGKRTIQDIADSMSVKLKTLVSDDFVWLALNELMRDGLIENADEMNAMITGFNRREIVKKIGLASVIALPIVSSVVAPSAAMAVSEAACDTGMTFACFCENTPIGSTCGIGVFIQCGPNCLCRSDRLSFGNLFEGRCE